MAIFEYKALQKDGSVKKSIIESNTAKDARLKLKKQGLIVTEISEKTAGSKSKSSGGGLPFIGNRVGHRDLSLVTRQLASLIKANIPLVEALRAMVDQVDNEKIKIVLDQVRKDVEEGSSLAKALAAHPKVFDTIFINMVEAGESSGTLGLILLRLADLKEAQLRLRTKVISGMTYPVLMLGVGLVLVIGIFTFVMPTFKEIFTSTKKPLPLLTEVLMIISDFIVGYWWGILIAAIFGINFMRKWIQSPLGKPKWDSLTLRLPVVGDMIRMIAVTRFATTMATLLGSGVPIISSLNITRNLMTNTHIQKALDNAKENITEGQSIADPLRRSGEFPPLVIHMISIGEKTGELPDMLKTIAETYEEQVNSKIDQAVALLEPIMIIGMGFFVGFIVLAVFIPLMEISNIN